MKTRYLIALCALLPALYTAAYAQFPGKTIKTTPSTGQTPAPLRPMLAPPDGAPVEAPAMQYRPLRGQLYPQQFVQPVMLSVVAVDEMGKPTFAEGPLPENTPALHNPEGLQQAGFALLENLKHSMRIVNPAAEFEVTVMETDALGQRHLRLQQVYQGLPVYGAEVRLHFTATEQIFNGRYQPTPAGLSTQAALSEQQAIAKVIEEVQQHSHYRELNETERQFLQYARHRGELVIYPTGGLLNRFRLAWHVSMRPNFVERWEYFVDAENGKVLNHYNHTCSVGPATGTSSDLRGVSRSFGIFQAQNGTYYMVDASKPMYTGTTTQLPALGKGIIVTANLNNTNTRNPQFSDVTSATTNNWNATAVSSHYNAGVAFEYFRSTFNRNSINGTGGDVISFINVADDNGQGMDNAFWNGKAMFYGNGRVAFTPLAASLDVAGHEMSHGVIQETANLVYQDEPGALNESFADVFGVMIDRDDWGLGEDVVRASAFPSGFLRSMSNPHNGGTSLSSPGWQPKRYSERYTGSDDNGGVHINSGITNHAFYLFATAIGKDKAEQVYYRALNQYLTKSSRFIDCRLAVIRAATDLHGANSAEVNAARSAFDQVEIFDPNSGGGNPTPPPSDLPVNPGAEYLLVADSNTPDPNKIYIAPLATGMFTPISQRLPQNRVSIRDDGRFAYFVGTDKHIYILSLSTTNPQLTQLSTSPQWDNVAISKNGSRLAAVTTSIDTAIYVFDFSGTTVRTRRFKLYNPTYTQGVNVAGVLYADALEWDYSGEHVMYDAFNRINSTSGFPLEYFDIGVIRVWNNTSNDFGDGRVDKLFTLDEGESVGNPIFSKNSPHIIAFDYINENTNEYFVLGSNLETGAIGAIYQQNVLGFPNYNKLDNRMAFNARNQNNLPIVAFIDLQANKIQGVANSAVVGVNEAQFPAFFSVGARVLNVGADAPVVDAGGFRASPVPFQDELQVHHAGGASAAWQAGLYDLTGRLVASAAQPAGVQELTLRTEHLAPGAYVLRLQAGEAHQTFKVLKQ